MAKPGTLPRAKTPPTVYPLVAFVVLYYVELVARGPATVLGTAVGVLVILVVISAAQLTATAALRMRIVYLRIGGGRVLKRGVSGDRVWSLCALPIVCVAFGLPRPGRVARDVRTVSALVLAVEVVGGAIGAMVILHGAAAAFFAIDLVLLITIQLMARAPESGRLHGARVFRPATADRDPLLAVPAVATANHAVFDAHFGDVAAARAILEQLGGAHGPASTGADFSVAILAMEVLAAGGRFAEAAQVPMPAPEAEAGLDPTVQAVHRSAYSARVAKYLMLAAESTTGMDSTTGALVLNHLKQTAQGPTAAGQEREGRSLYALAVGDIKTAAREARITTARARTPLMLANAYCTEARIAAARGRHSQARALIAKAHSVAPWYPRIAVVNGIVTSPYAAAAVPPPPPGAPTDHLFTDPWSAQ
jgi:hypothetical protein